MSLFDAPPTEEDDPFAFSGNAVQHVDRPADESMPDAGAVYDAFTRAKPSKVPMKRDTSQFARAIAELHRLFPDVPMSAWEKTEHRETLYSGIQVTRDLWGFADVVGLRRLSAFGVDDTVTACQVIACQMTTVDQIAPHIRKFTDATTKSLNEVPTLTKLRHFLDCGNILIILGYEKVGARWTCRHTFVTHELLDKAIQRKTGTKAEQAAKKAAAPATKRR